VAVGGFFVVCDHCCDICLMSFWLGVACYAFVYNRWSFIARTCDGVRRKTAKNAVSDLFHWNWKYCSNNSKHVFIRMYRATGTVWNMK
jgi:hypothetical protein